MNGLQKVISFLKRLWDEHIDYKMEGPTEVRPVEFHISRPGEKWKVVITKEGQVDVEIIRKGDTVPVIEGEEALERLFKKSHD